MAGIGKLSRQHLSQVLRKVKGGCITSESLSKSLNVSTSQARAFLSSWAVNGWLPRVRQEVYAPINIAASLSVQPLIDPWIIANELFTPCYIEGWSTAEHWG